MTKPIKKQKFYAYIDESGQDTKGKFFVVSVLILENNKDLISKKLEKIEITSKKPKKWLKTRYQNNQKYIETISKTDFLKQSIFFDTFYNTKEYLKCTAQGTSRAILNKTKSKKNYTTIIYIDGFEKTEIENFKKEIKSFNIKRQKIRGVKKDENNVFIRLADAICGLVMQSQKQNQWAKDILEEMKKRKIIKEV
jgi:hypothetical protein